MMLCMLSRLGRLPTVPAESLIGRYKVHQGRIDCNRANGGQAGSQAAFCSCVVVLLAFNARDLARLHRLLTQQHERPRQNKPPAEADEGAAGFLSSQPASAARHYE
jgi:hypothetical protein